MMTFIVGGARSGKSEFAAQLADASGRAVLFVATMRELDDEIRARVAAHRTARPAHWRTIETPVSVIEALRDGGRDGEFVIIDCVTAWISNLLLDALPDAEGATVGQVDAAMLDVRRTVSDLIAWARAFPGEVAVVSNEVGSGVVPAYALGRIFRDATGAANKALAAEADRALLGTSGLA
jgi:adenosylcobinamide kinase/adenosylcobinamide-phosphate guanylyltransferase